MTPLETAVASADAVHLFSSHFMLDPPTYTRGTDLGFAGMDFYVAGRCGVLGPVDADVVAAALVFFNPVAVRAAWEASVGVMEPIQATLAFAECGYEWAQRIPDDIDVERLAVLAAKVVAGASPAVAPLFAGWRALPEPADPKALTLHRMNILRELRGNLHGAAVLAAGLTPLEAMMVKTPYMVGIFGWTENLPERDPARERLARADEMTNQMIAPTFEALTEAEREEFVELANAAEASVVSKA